MPSASDIATYTEQVVSDCRLTSTSIFFVDQTVEHRRVSYLYHTGVSDEAKHIYSSRMVYLSDPFAKCGKATNEFIRWEAPHLGPMMQEAADYRGFLTHHNINVVGAWCRGLTDDLSLIIGTHRANRIGQADDVPIGLLQDRLNSLSNMVVEHLFAELLDNSAGQIALRFALPGATATTSETVRMSDRECEIAALICEGKQNKQVAWTLGISEFTVENHLRRIYRKLGIHSRAALVAHFSRRVH
ncbi:LuxR C-terminal-related transcriptional regulator [Novosphingobium colocasiae]|uniref:helix-turn-helix transcriptional regulator n=1 Tax=Novosphingobium colocasiae TaxID=1256513 RepID=UPI0035B05AEA